MRGAWEVWATGAYNDDLFVSYDAEWHQSSLVPLVCLCLADVWHLLASGTDIRTVQDLRGHASVETTMIYLHTLKRPGAGGASPLDLP